ncbi:hypothetical protein, partial [Bartonella bovis]|uniref:hypothetical protein n=1 Tax=Bartonella bovis TaxID=155194 RepID=UPI001304FAB4
KVGVHAKNGKVNINMGEITFEGNGQGVTIMGDGSGMGSKGVLMDGTKMTMTDVTISNVSEGVYATGMGKLTINGEAKITFKGGAGNYGVMVGRMGTANLTGTR